MLQDPPILLSYRRLVGAWGKERRERGGNKQTSQEGATRQLRGGGRCTRRRLSRGGQCSSDDRIHTLSHLPLGIIGKAAHNGVSAGKRFAESLLVLAGGITLGQRQERELERVIEPQSLAQLADISATGGTSWGLDGDWIPSSKSFSLLVS